MSGPFGEISMGLSGGGSRALGYHLGVLWYLNRLDLLKDVKVMSSSSGGSMVTATYAMSQAKGQAFEEYFDWMVERMMSARIVEGVFEELSSGTPKNISHRRSLVVALAEVYNRHFFQDFEFGQLIENNPGHLRESVINATDFRTGLGFRFQRHKPVGNGRMSIAPEDIRHMRLADAMAASSCLPGGLEPFFFPEDFVWKGEEAREDATRLVEQICAHGVETVHLMDGGINDNQGLEGLMLAAIRISENTPEDADDGAFAAGKELAESGDDAQAHMYEFDLLFQRVATETIPESPPGLVILSDAPLDPDPVYRAGYAPGNERPLRGLKPPPDRGPTLERLTRWWKALYALSLASTIALAIAYVFAFKEARGWTILQSAERVLVYLFPLALCGAVVWALRFIKKQLLALANAVNRVLLIEGTHPTGEPRSGNSWQYLKKLRLSHVIYLLGLRASSLVSLSSDIFFIRTRILNYTTLYTLPGWRKQLITNEIYDVLDASGKDVPRATQPMKKVAEVAANMPTAFWFEKPQDLPSLIATGQMNICLNLIVHLRRARRTKAQWFKPEHEVLLKKTEADWQQLESHPRCFAPSTHRLSALEAERVAAHA
jgi:predicted acylesterase/phospholipase RssA